MKEILQEIARRSSSGETAALAIILSGSGSLPMSRRSKMLILADGSQRGTVGGGCLEAEVHAEGRRAIRTGRATLKDYTLTEDDVAVLSLFCDQACLALDRSVN